MCTVKFINSAQPFDKRILRRERIVMPIGRRAERKVVEGKHITNMKRTEKTFFVENLTEELKSATCVVLVDYTGLSVKMQQDLKKKLKSCSAKMLIVKNTLFKLAGKSANVPNETISDSVLSGPTAIIVSEKDPIAPLQILAKFAKENDILNFKVGIIEGIFQDKDALLKLSTLPSKEILYAQLVSSISAPMYGIVSTLQGNLQKLIWILNEKFKMAG